MKAVLTSTFAAVAMVLAACAGNGLDLPTEAATQTAIPPLEGRYLLRFAAIGDFGTGDTDQQAVARRMCTRYERRPFQMVVTTGDNVYPDGDPSNFSSAFFGPYACLFRAGVPFHASLGNHDIITNGGRPEIREPAFGMKGRNYVIRRRGVRFVFFDSNSPNFEWLDRALVADAGDRWTVVAFHHPVYSPGKHGPSPELQESLPRMFRRRGVDLVLSGHDHLYAATRPLHDIRYVVTGGGGAALYRCARPAFSGRCSARHHFLDVTVHVDRIEVRAVPPQGRAFHRFTTQGIP